MIPSSVRSKAAQRSYSLSLNPLKSNISQPPRTFTAQRAYRLPTPSRTSSDRSAELFKTSPLRQAGRNKLSNRAYATLPDSNDKEPSVAVAAAAPEEEEMEEEEVEVEKKLQAHLLKTSKISRQEQWTIDPNIDHEKYPDYVVVSGTKIPYVHDHETTRGDMSDFYHPEGDFGLARPWLRPVYDPDAEEPDYSEEVAAYERRIEGGGESIYIPPGKTIDDLKWGVPLDKKPKRGE